MIEANAVNTLQQNRSTRQQSQSYESKNSNVVDFQNIMAKINNQQKQSNKAKQTDRTREKENSVELPKKEKTSSASEEIKAKKDNASSVAQQEQQESETQMSRELMEEVAAMLNDNSNLPKDLKVDGEALMELVKNGDLKSLKMIVEALEKQMEGLKSSETADAQMLAKLKELMKQLEASKEMKGNVSNLVEVVEVKNQGNEKSGALQNLETTRSMFHKTKVEETISQNGMSGQLDENGEEGELIKPVAGEELKKDGLFSMQQGATEPVVTPIKETVALPQIKNLEEIKMVLEKQIAITTKEAQSSITLKLKPEALGQVKIQLSMLEDGTLKGKIFVDNEIAHKSLVQQIDNLKTQLRAQNVNFESFEISYNGGFEQQFNGKEQDANQTISQNRFGSDFIEDIPIEEALNNEQSDEGINTLA